MLNKMCLVGILEQLIDAWFTCDRLKLQLTKIVHEVPLLFVLAVARFLQTWMVLFFLMKKSSVISPLVALLLFSHFFPLLPSETCGVYTLFKLFFFFFLFIHSGKYMLRLSVFCSSLPPYHSAPFWIKNITVYFLSPFSLTGTHFPRYLLLLSSISCPQNQLNAGPEQRAFSDLACC